MIDVHLHVVHDHNPGAKPDPGDESVLDKRIDDLAAIVQREMAAAGITIALGMGRLDAPPDDPLGINGTLRLATLIPGLKAIGVADPSKQDDDHLRRAADQLASGAVVALKAYLGYTHHGPDSPAYRPYYRLARQFQIPFIFHTGDTWSTTARVRYAHPLLVDDVAVEHPDVNFVLAHFGNPWLIDAAEVVLKNENVWADLSGLLVGDEAAFELTPDGKAPPDTLLADVVHDVRKAFRFTEKPERFLYGSDWPLVPMAAYRRFVALAVPREHHEAVFEKNARALFRLN